MGENEKKKKHECEYECLKKLGIKSEKELNQLIHKWLDDPEVIELLKLGARLNLKAFKLFKKKVKCLSSQLPIPTKEDMTHIAKLLMHFEEKLDCLEDKVLECCDKKPDNDKAKKCDGKKNKHNKKTRKEELRQWLKESIQCHDPKKVNSDIERFLETLLERRR